MLFILYKASEFLMCEIVGSDGETLYYVTLGSLTKGPKLPHHLGRIEENITTTLKKMEDYVKMSLSIT